jgi:4-aminobutyrate aminotransferase-like enzyme
VKLTSKSILRTLRDYESRNVTFQDPAGDWPIVWKRAKGCFVQDLEGKKYLDLMAAFGVAAAGHANPRVVDAAKSQLDRLVHGMGDVHPHAPKAQLVRELSRLTFERWSRKLTDMSLRGAKGKTIFCNSGFEAVEAALKTAALATGKPGVVAFQGGYHGLGYGALNATHREHFRGPFTNQLAEFGHFAPFPDDSQSLQVSEQSVRRHFHQRPIGAVLVEPLQGRGGIHVPPADFLPMLRRVCDQYGALLILDEIYTGFGRTGKWFACEHSGVMPDVICLGKALTGGFPLSACVGRDDLMDQAWPESQGEAIHTSTFLGHPVGCAMALAQLKEIKDRHLPQKAGIRGKLLLRLLSSPPLPIAGYHFQARGQGLFAGLEITRKDDSPATEECIEIVKRMLTEGYILLPEGEHANVISFTPPLIITEKQLQQTVDALHHVIIDVLTA